MTEQNPYPLPLPGGQCPVAYNVTIAYEDKLGDTVTVRMTLNGPLKGLGYRSFYSSPEVRTMTRFKEPPTKEPAPVNPANAEHTNGLLGQADRQITWTLQFVNVVNGVDTYNGVGSALNQSALYRNGNIVYDRDPKVYNERIVKIERVDGQPDDCGNLPNIPIDLAGHPGNCKRYPCSQTQQLNSEVELHTGALIETQSLVSYQSLGTTRELTLRYDSLTADPRPYCISATHTLTTPTSA